MSRSISSGSSAVSALAAAIGSVAHILLLLFLLRFEENDGIPAVSHSASPLISLRLPVALAVDARELARMISGEVLKHAPRGACSNASRIVATVDNSV